MINELIDKLNTHGTLDAIVIEGYDGVGKGRILNELSEYYGVKPYRPDYNLWQMFDHRKQDRWKVSGFFWDVYSHFNKGCHSFKPMLFDRGVISGAVYNDDMSIACHYKEMIRDMKVMHVLITCSYEDYTMFAKIRNPHVLDADIVSGYGDYLLYTNRYIEALKSAGVDYIVYENKYNNTILDDICSSCGHYSYGWCRHPKNNFEVDGNRKRCELAEEREVQDIDSEMYSMQS